MQRASSMASMHSNPDDWDGQALNPLNMLANIDPESNIQDAKLYDMIIDERDFRKTSDKGFPFANLAADCDQDFSLRI